MEHLADHIDNVMLVKGIDETAEGASNIASGLLGAVALFYGPLTGGASLALASGVAGLSAKGEQVLRDACDQKLFADTHEIKQIIDNFADNDQYISAEFKKLQVLNQEKENV